MDSVVIRPAVTHRLPVSFQPADALVAAQAVVASLQRRLAILARVTYFPDVKTVKSIGAGLDGTGLCVGEGGNKYRESMRIGSCRSDRCNGRRSCKGCCSIRPRPSRNAFPSSLSNATLSFSMDNSLPNNIPSGH